MENKTFLWNIRLKVITVTKKNFSLLIQQTSVGFKTV